MLSGCAGIANIDAAFDSDGLRSHPTPVRLRWEKRKLCNCRLGDMMSVSAFVEQQFGSKAARYLKHIRTGGDNNRKGAGYESFYAVAKICDLAVNHAALDDFILSSQEEAFVDDLCIRQLSKPHKTNYQAKNSSGTAADWDADMEQRFRWQHEIDREVHKYPSNSQVLLVSCPQKAAANESKIPNELKEICFSEYFPYQASVIQLVMSCLDLRSTLEKLCGSRDLSVIDCAFRLVLSAWSADDRPRSAGDIIGMAKAMARPNIFADFLPERQGVPGWLLEKCSNFTGFNVHMEFARFIISYNGLEVSLASDSSEPDSNILDSLTTPREFLAFLMSKSQTELQN